jgi:hypothetical protein
LSAVRALVEVKQLADFVALDSLNMEKGPACCGATSISGAKEHPRRPEMIASVSKVEGCEGSA